MKEVIVGDVFEKPKCDERKKSKRSYAAVDNKNDYFVRKDGLTFAGTHLLLELWECKDLSDPGYIDQALCDAAHAAGAAVLHSHFHRFSPNEGVSGVLVLAESHISIHTWPEHAFAAIDIFMCGECDPYKSIPVLRERFDPGNIQLTEHRRGMVL